jgi:hypothetical protein
MGFSPTSGERSAVVERCISLYAQTIASLPGTHWRANNRGGRTRVQNSWIGKPGFQCDTHPLGRN